MTTKTVRVGIAVFVLNPENKFILGQRIGSHGAGIPVPANSLFLLFSKMNEVLMIQEHGPSPAATSNSTSPLKSAPSAKSPRKQDWRLPPELRTRMCSS